MAALVLFGAVACGASSSSSTTSSAKPTAAQKAAALDKSTCQKVLAGTYTTKAQATAFIQLLEGQASQAGVDNTLSGAMMNLSTILSGHESGVKALSSARVTTAQQAVKSACKKWVS